MKKSSLIIAFLFFIVGCTKIATNEDLVFKKLCENSGNEWMRMKPTKEGKMIKDAEECFGCMVGLEHICNKEKFIEMTSEKEEQTEKLDSKVSDDINSLPLVKKSEIVNLKNNELFHLEAMPVLKEIAGRKIRMYSYNGQIPGPLIKAVQNTTIYINFTNNIDMDTTIHWHGVRLKNEYDGVPDITQEPIKHRESFLYEVYLPDEGVYWYHPHIREDLQQELGLYGNIIVEPVNEDYYNKADKKEFLFSDDIKLSANGIDVFGKDFARFALMGRFGNVLLVNGDTDYKLDVKKGDIVRFYITNSANTRTFNFSIENHKLKQIGSDSGKFERESIINSVVISPGERYIIEVLFDQNGEYKLLHNTPDKVYELGIVAVEENSKADTLNFTQLNENSEIKNSINKFRKYFNMFPDYEFDLTIEMQSMAGMDHGMTNTNQPIEWEDEMPQMNAMSTSKNTKWVIKDKRTGKENMDINYNIKVGDVKKIRIFNDPKSMHPMQHPMHLHGQRFLVLVEDGKINNNLAWKDTVLVPKGSTVDLLVDFTNPGKWMFHCHIAEHLESGMMAMFDVET